MVTKYLAQYKVKDDENVRAFAYKIHELDHSPVALDIRIAIREFDTPSRRRMIEIVDVIEVGTSDE